MQYLLWPHLSWPQAAFPLILDRLEFGATTGPALMHDYRMEKTLLPLITFLDTNTLLIATDITCHRGPPKVKGGKGVTLTAAEGLQESVAQDQYPEVQNLNIIASFQATLYTDWHENTGPQ